METARRPIESAESQGAITGTLRLMHTIPTTMTTIKTIYDEMSNMMVMFTGIKRFLFLERCEEGFDEILEATICQLY